MDFVDNQLDRGTGHDRSAAPCFPTPTCLLSPGLFARLRLLGSGALPRRADPGRGGR